MASPSTKGGYYTNPFPVIEYNGNVCNWNFSSIHFGLIPKLKFTSTNMGGWVEQHLKTMYSNRELQALSTATPPSDSMTAFKKSIYDIFVNVVNTKNRVFEIKSSVEDKPSFILFVVGLFLDDNTRTILAETYVLPLPVANRSLDSVVREICKNSVKLILGTDAARLWKSALPAMIERSRDFRAPILMQILDRKSSLRSNYYPQMCLCYNWTGSIRGSNLAETAISA